MYESRHHPPLSHRHFLRRLAVHAAPLFAGFYALYAGLIFLVAMGLVLAPVVHRVLHKFHWDDAGTA